jgi:hypothetical protein
VQGKKGSYPVELKSIFLVLKWNTLLLDETYPRSITNIFITKIEL